jgi:quercetin dioxygenase-like cupin family protein
MIVFKLTKPLISLFACSIFCFSSVVFAGNSSDSNASVAQQIFEKAKQNDNWKQAFLTAKDAQVVFMNISPQTNPNNEIGMETHKFDQIIFVVEGNGKAVLNGKETMVKTGDMIFIPQGVAHNVINANATSSLKILSVYTATDIPAGASYQKKSDATND